ncbi:hypothetical protein [Halobacteriovorax sp. HLS]|uniref:hypothetical protein n=1 Tax=Halobacteriovorax sp. HLS TaxID=2234000 RepID=UPI000FD706B9|nr:hypothetical protein [Halobacteriovorax sp. HLS]
MSDIKKELFNSIGKYEQSHNIEDYFEYLTQLQAEQAPWLDKNLIEVSVFQSFAKYYNDHNIDYIICKYLEQSYEQTTHRTAA